MVLGEDAQNTNREKEGIYDPKQDVYKRQAYVKAIIESVDHAVEDIVKVNVYLADIADLAAMNEAYVALFGDHKPARKVVGCGELPFGARVMIDAIAGNWEGTPPVA